MKQKNIQWYSILIALTMVSFLLVMVVWVFHLILQWLSDNRWIWSSIKAYFWAEAAQELALLTIKSKWYGFSDRIEHNINSRSVVLSHSPKDISLFKGDDVFISYDLWIETQVYTWVLDTLWYDIIPLFYLTGSSSQEKKLTHIKVDVLSWDSDAFVWNIVWEFRWISWTWSFNKNSQVIEKSHVSSGFLLDNTLIYDFLSSSSKNYLILFNANKDTTIEYRVSSVDDGEYFSKPRVEILSRAQVWNYKQNLRTTFDNAEFLGNLKYSLYSNN